MRIVVQSKIRQRVQQQNKNYPYFLLMQGNRVGEEDEQEIISIIKTIASELLTDDDDFPFGQHSPLDLGPDFKAQTRSHQNYVLYSQRDDEADCQSEWIDYEDLRGRNAENINQTPIALTQSHGVKKQTHNKRSQIKKQTKPFPPAQKHKFNEKQEQGEEKPKPKIKLDELSTYGFMKPKSKVTKDQIISDVYHKQSQKEEDIAKTKKRFFKTLEQLYQEKLPLYDKYIKNKEKKVQAIYESRMLEEREIEGMHPYPTINRNIDVQGNFESRLQWASRKAEQKKVKILNEVLQQVPFQPNTNKRSKLGSIESVVKKQWGKNTQQLKSETSKHFESQTTLSETRVKLTNSNTNSATKMDTVRENSQVRLKDGVIELSNILEIDQLYAD